MTKDVLIDIDNLTLEIISNNHIENSNIKVAIEFPFTTFNSDIVFSNCTFKKKVKFSNCHFNKRVFFIDCTFEKDVDFSYSLFACGCWQLVFGLVAELLLHYLI